MVKPSEILKPGIVGVNTKGAVDLLGTINTVAEGDSKGAHVWLVLPNGKIATTGAKGLVVYGEVDPDEYLAGKTCYLLETVDPLTPGQLAIIQACHEEMMASGLGRLYGIWKIPVLIVEEIFVGAPAKFWPSVRTNKPICPICDQAVGYPLWKAGVCVGKGLGKKDWTALSPAVFLAEGQQTSYNLKAGLMNDRSGNCYLLRTIQDEPFRF